MQLAVRSYLDAYEKHSYINPDESSYVNKDEFIDCSLGTNPFGFSKTIYERIGEIDLASINQYPMYPYAALIDKVVDYWSQFTKLDKTWIQCGSGSMSILNTINKMMIDEETYVLGYTPQFSDYASNVESFGGNYESVSLLKKNNFKFNGEEFIEAISRKHRIVYLDNPNNPTGQVIELSVIRKIVQKAKAVGAIVIVDEAYGDFMEQDNSSVLLISEFDNLMVTKSLSKGFGVAGLRVGYLVTNSSLMRIFQKVELPFCLTSLGYEIALKVMDDRDFITSSNREVEKRNKLLVESVEKLVVHETSLSVPITVIEHPNPNINLHELFMSKKILTESGVHFKDLAKNHVRLRIPKEMDVLISAIGEIEMEMSEHN